jgi:uncharacterized membrane protein YraQ (UPF0718 family)
MLREVFDRSFFIFAVLALATGVACYLDLGSEAFNAALLDDMTLVGFLIPKLGAALLIAAFVQVLLPPSFFARIMGEESGVKGMAVATAAGTVTPGGPMTSFPLVTVLRDGGTGIGPLVTYITAWTTMGLQRVFMWEVPLMGVEFAVIRFISSMPLGFIAGFIAKCMPRVQAVQPGE